MLAIIGSAALLGIDAVPVQVEVNTGESGVPNLILVGLPDAAVKESEDRVFSALSNSGLKMPRTRTTINLAPGDLRKEGAIYDLPIALGILVATAQLVCKDLNDYLIAGELSLSGATRPVKGGLAMAVLARELGKKAILLPAPAAQEAALVAGVEVYEISSLDQANRFLAGQISLTPTKPVRNVPAIASPLDGPPDFADIKGQHSVRRAVEVAVAGGHNLIMLFQFAISQNQPEIFAHETPLRACAEGIFLPPVLKSRAGQRHILTTPDRGNRSLLQGARVDVG